MRRLGLALSALVFLLVTTEAGAVTPAPGWSIESLAYPSDFSTADNSACEHEVKVLAFAVCDTYAITATNVGSTPVFGTVTLSDSLPPGLTVRNVSLFLGGVKRHEAEDLAGRQIGGAPVCSTAPLKCVVPLPTLVPDEDLQHKGGKLRPGQSLKMYVSVLVNGPASPGNLLNGASVSGGGAAEATVQRSNTLENGPPAFGTSLFGAPLLGEDGLPDTQAGGHPYGLDTRIGLNTIVREGPEGNTVATAIQDPRDVIVDLPLGLAGSGMSAPQCSLARLGSKGAGEERQALSGCPANTVVGRIRTYPETGVAAIGSIYNLVPERGVAAELGFIDITGGTHVLYVGLVPTPEGYVLRTTAREVPQLALNEIAVHVFGDPAAEDETNEPGTPTFTNPASCDGKPLKTTLMMDSWQAPGSYNTDGTPNLADPRWTSTSYESPPVTGCDQLLGLFEPSITATPTSPRAASPTGLDVDLAVPQHTGANELATPPVRDTTVTLPAGMTVNPSSANGLEACSLEQIGMSPSGVPNASAPHCPDGSKIGTVALETPALAMEACNKTVIPIQECPAEERTPAPLSGSIYVARQTENPFGSLLAIYIVVDDPRTGVIVKLPARVNADPVTGQLTTTVSDTPQFPFSLLRTHFFAGDNAALSNPPECGSYTTNAQLTPWSAPESGPPATPSASFDVTQSADGGACSALGFGPSLQAGTSQPRAGAFSPLSVTFARHDTEQNLSGVSVTTPPGLLGTIRGIPQCPEPLAASGQCSPASLLGEVTTAVGAGPHPYWVHGGKAYLTGPYKGAPFGLSILVPTTAGPYTLTGNAGPGREVVRAAIRVDPATAQITVAGDPLPTILEGIPLQVRAVNVTINRPNFTFNPTNCSRLETTATFTSTQQASATGSSPFYASGCAALPFHPTLTASSQAKTSRVNGASLDIRVASKPGEADVAKTDLQLPAQLPSRLTTLHHACLAAQFNANPAGCPAESNIGMATVTTPVLNSPLSGPIYLVSFGNAGFPDTEIVLQGEGVTTILDGKTDIKRGITYSNFESIPDVPFTSFTAHLPAGPHSVFAAFLPSSANESLCGQGLVIPTTIVGQNGRGFRQSTPIRVTGCPTGVAVRGKHVRRRGHRATLVLSIYTPTAGTLHITGRGVDPATARTQADRNSTVTLNVKPGHPSRTRLTLTLTSHGARKLVSHITAKL